MMIRNQKSGQLIVSIGLSVKKRLYQGVVDK